MKLEKTTLSNGLRVCVISLPHVHQVELGVFVLSGPRFESRENMGISHFVEHMLFRGTRSQPDTRALHAAVERLGQPIAASTGRDMCQYSFAVPPRNLKAATTLFADIMLEPTFDQLEVERRVVLEELLNDYDENGQDVNLEFHARNLLWPGSSLAASIVGTESTVRSFTREHLIAHHRRFYTGHNCLLYFVGALEADEAFELAERTFARMPAGERLYIPEVIKTVEGPDFRFIDLEDSQEQFCLSFACPSYLHPDHGAVLTLHNILADGVSSRLNWHICERQGMSYDIDAAMETYFDTGSFDIQSSVARGRLLPLLREVLHVLRDIRQVEVTSLEMEKAIHHSRFANDYVLDNPSALASWLVATEMFAVAPSIEDFQAQIERLTPADIKRVASSLFTPENAVLVVAGRRNRGERAQFARLLELLAAEE